MLLAVSHYDEKIVTLAGDGIGPEIMAAGLEVLEAVASKLILIMTLMQNLLVAQELMPMVIHYQKKLWMRQNQLMRFY